ncbi:hypothetical protein ERJ75_001648400 [Trypanosoma vivax]|uniref:Putative intergrin alpha chain protein n=1 Tax=Trypanosoma vivax (strain Y486) TaxID=1055687 RepID=G0U9C5_TRYVY|nr:putative intergrin alpha chain protein [Trypanosoma vivax]KAH8604919.1 hypothetical protein ERJ75_001648400 [Trypanosoma vivax]CCC54210.1 putative intergrin alpha chain protein [Trypanosoma vivax Y486]
MRLRDIFIVGVAIVFCIFGWSQENGIALWKGFYISSNDRETQRYVMSKPIVLDRDGDGRPVLIASVSYGVLEMFYTNHVRGTSENVFPALQPKLWRTFYTRITAIGAGRLSNKNSSHAVAIVTADFQLHRLSANDFSTVWSTPIVNVLGESYLTSVSVLPERVYEEDEGTIVVAAHVPGPNQTQLMLFAAFNGADGELRWRYTTDADSSVREVLSPSVSTAAEEASSGDSTIASARTTDPFRLHEKPWSFFREAVVTLLPHRYAHPWDERIRPHVFFHTKNRKKRAAHSGKQVVVKYKDRFIRMNEENYGELGEKLGLLNADEKHKDHTALPHQRGVNVLAFHGPHGVEVLHLYTGNLITRLAPLKSTGVLYHDLGDDFQIDVVGTRIGPRMQVHSSHGLEITDECMGTIHTGIPLAEEKLFSTSICNTEGFLGRLDLIRDFVGGDIRGEGTSSVIDALELMGSQNVLSKTTRSVTPLVVQLHTVKGRGLFQVERYAVFMIDSGLITCVDPSRGRVLWRSQTDASFENVGETHDAESVMVGLSEMEVKYRTRPFPHLAPYNFEQKNEDSVGHVGGVGRYRNTDPYIIAVGESCLTLLSARTGRVMRVVLLDEVPVAPVIVQDFNGDGINDIIVVTEGGIYGYVMGAQTSSDTITALMILMIGLLAVLVAVREMNRGNASEEQLLPTTSRDVQQMVQSKIRRATD